MKKPELLHIEYEKATNLGSGSKGEITERYVIPTYTPPPNMKAIDVTDLTEEERTAALALYNDYQEYYATAMKALFSYEDWISHTQGGVDNTVKWRTFRMDNVTILD